MTTANPSIPSQVERIAAGDRLLTPAEVSAIFRVDPKTVTRWAGSGKLAAVKTPGGHRRFWKSDVEALLGVDSPQGES